MTLPQDPPNTILRPTRPLAAQPAGYVGLARYSSLSHLWRVLAGAGRAGREISLVRGDSPETARRRIGGYALTGGGIFLDPAPLLRDLEEGFAVHPALLALLSGDTEPLKAELNARYELKLDFTVALTASRDFICRPDFKFVPLSGDLLPGSGPLPKDLPLRARRFSRDEINMLLLRACALA